MLLNIGTGFSRFTLPLAIALESTALAAETVMMVELGRAAGA